MKKFSKIYLDMDGVVADFKKRYKEIFDIDPEVAEKKKQFYGYFQHFVDAGHFATLDLMPDAIELIEYLKKLPIPIEMLSSTANEQMYDKISTQKKIWLDTHNIEFKGNFVPGAKNKYKWATPDSIIIDDTERVIDDLIKAGGVAIWHKNAKDTIKILQMLGL